MAGLGSEAEIWVWVFLGTVLPDLSPGPEEMNITAEQFVSDLYEILKKPPLDHLVYLTRSLFSGILFPMLNFF